MNASLGTRSILSVFISLGLACSLPTVAMGAKVSGICSKCHTMHNSFENAEVVTDSFGADTGPQEVLLNKAGSCMGCHSGKTDVPANMEAPFVFALNDADAIYQGVTGVAGTTLAGGNFRFALIGTDAADKMHHGHNVVSQTAMGLPEDTQVTVSPGSGGINASDLSCAGTNGCHGDKSKLGDFAGIRGFHHGGDVNKTGYRYLRSPDGSQEILGLPDADWEFTYASDDHNVYYGQDGVAAPTQTISALCGRCHGDFHGSVNTNSASPWIRHPTDFDLARAAGTEYAGYGLVYDPLVPLANTDYSAVNTAVLTTSGAGDDSAIVMCLSCHRAHATPYQSILRWDYTKMLATTADAADYNTGCFKCHGTKDGDV